MRQASGIGKSEWEKQWWRFFAGKANQIIKRSDFDGEVRSMNFVVGILLSDKWTVSLILGKRDFVK